MPGFNLARIVVKWIIRGLDISVDTLRIGTIISMTGLIFIQVMLRVFAKWSSAFWEETSRFLLIWSIMTGIVVTTMRDEHIKISLLDSFVYGKKKRLIFEVGSKFICFIFMCIFTWWCWDFLIWSIKTNQQSYVLSIPMYVVHSAFVVCAFLSTVYFLLLLINRIIELVRSVY